MTIWTHTVQNLPWYKVVDHSSRFGLPCYDCSTSLEWFERAEFQLPFCNMWFPSSCCYQWYILYCQTQTSTVDRHWQSCLWFWLLERKVLWVFERRDKTINTLTLSDLQYNAMTSSGLPGANLSGNIILSNFPVRLNESTNFPQPLTQICFFE